MVPINLSYRKVTVPPWRVGRLMPHFQGLGSCAELLSAVAVAPDLTVLRSLCWRACRVFLCNITALFRTTVTHSAAGNLWEAGILLLRLHAVKRRMALPWQW